jgi:hypothetical protein
VIRWMKKLLSLGLLLTELSALGYAQSSAAHRVKITLLSHESSIHTSLENRDAYIVRVTARSGREFVARMIDEYPSYAADPPFSSLADGAVFSVALRKMAYCDSGLADGVQQPMRCFALVHGSWKLPKADADEQWWK